MNQITNDLYQQCDYVRRQLETKRSEANDEFIQEALDLEFTVNVRGHYLGTNILCTFGGPNIRVDTRYNRIDGCWGGEQIKLDYDDMNDLHDYCAGLFLQ